MIQFCPIAPVSYLRPLSVASLSSTHLVLAHLADNREYVAYYGKNNPAWDNRFSRERTLILDNSGFEMFRLGKPMFDGKQLVDIASKFDATHIVMPDYPGEDPYKTMSAAMEFAPQFRAARKKTFFVPQGRPGNVEDYISSFAWAASSPLVDYIGVSILAAPIAFNCDQPGHIQTFLARIRLCNILKKRGLLSLATHNGKSIHFLGMTDGPREIEYAIANNVVPDSWDSSAPIWAGIMDTEFDDTPTGLRNGKIHTHVDFDIAFDETKVNAIKHNLKFIKDLITA
jgi:hypothetical protein